MDIEKVNSDLSGDARATDCIEKLRRAFPRVGQRTAAKFINDEDYFGYAQAANVQIGSEEYNRLVSLVISADCTLAPLATIYGRVRAADAKVKGHDNRGSRTRQTQAA